MTDSERKSILQQQIMQYISQGWTVTSQTDTTAQLLLSPKKGILRFIMLGGIFYFGRKSKSIYITVNEEGKISKTETKR